MAFVELVWTNEKPEEPGYYWHRVEPPLFPSEEQPEIIKVEANFTGRLGVYEGSLLRHIEISEFSERSRFGGPIPEPVIDTEQSQ